MHGFNGRNGKLLKVQEIAFNRKHRINSFLLHFFIIHVYNPWCFFFCNKIWSRCSMFKLSQILHFISKRAVDKSLNSYKNCEHFQYALYYCIYANHIYVDPFHWHFVWVPFSSPFSIIIPHRLIDVWKLCWMNVADQTVIFLGQR